MKRFSKKVLSLVLSLVLVLSTLFALNTNIVNAATTGAAGESVTWNYNTTTNTLTLSGTGPTYNFRATNLGSNKKVPWSDYTSKMTTVVVGEGITELGQYAFYKCEALTKVTLPSTLIKIGGLGTMTTSYGCFQACSALKEITLPNKLESIGNCAFKDCTALTSITFPDSFTELSYGAFNGCTKLATVTFGANLKTMGTAAFYNCTGLKTINWGGVEEIPTYAFYGYFGSSLDFPDTIKSIGFRSFAENYNIRKVTINNPDCVISTTGANITSGRSEVGSPFAGHQQEVTIYGHTGSTAQNFVETYTTDTTQHYTFVSIDPCDHVEKDTVVVLEPTCTEAGKEQLVCRSCGQIISTTEIPAVEHKYVEIESVDLTEENGHIYSTEECEKCGDIKDVITHARTGEVSPRYVWVDGYYEYTNTATCTRPGLERYKCTVEGCVMKIGNTETTQPTQETISGSLGKHNVSNWTVTQEATCTEDGKKVGVCDTCGVETTETIPATGHIYSTAEDSEDLVIEVTAEESEDGHSYKIYQCQNCEEQPIISVHEEWIEGNYTSRVISEAHCVIDGLRRDTCDIDGCSETRNVVLPANGQHEWYVTKETAANCTVTGQIYYACRNCDMTRTERTEALGHDYVKVPASSTLPTCDKPGYDFLKCTRCSATKQDTIPATGHIVDEDNKRVVSEATCEDAGSLVSNCAECGEMFTLEIPALGHDFVDKEVDLTNENKPGHALVTPTCSRCNTREASSMVHKEWLEGYYKPATDATDTFEATCNLQGYTSDVCTICNEKRRNYTPALGHMYKFLDDSKLANLDITNDALSGIIGAVDGAVESVSYEGMLYRCVYCQNFYRASAFELMDRWNNSVVNSRDINRTADHDGVIVDWSSLLDANSDGIINAKDYAIISRSKKQQSEKIEIERAKNIVNISGDDFGNSFNLSSSKIDSRFADLLPVTLTFTDLDGYAKVATLENPVDVTAEDFEKVRLIRSGDVLLTEDNEIIIAYKAKAVNANYIRLGTLDNTENIEEAFSFDSADLELTITHKNV